MATPKKGSESELKAEYRKWLREQGAYVFSPVQMGMGKTTVDDLVCWRGLFLAIEAKKPDTNKKPTLNQKTTLQEVSAAGGATLVAYSVDDVKARLRALHQFIAP